MTLSPAAERRGFDIVPSDRQDFIDRAIADHFAHHTFGKIAQSLLGFARAEEILLRVRDPVLHDPGNERGVEVASNHRLGIVGLLVALKWVRRSRRGKTKFKFQQALGRDDPDFVDIGNGVGQPRIFRAVVGAEAQLHAD